MTTNSQQNINQQTEALLGVYSSFLYDKADFFLMLKNFFYFIFLICLALSVYLEGFYLYVITIFSVIAQILGWFFYYKSISTTNLALEFKKISILYNAYKCIPNRFGLSHLLAKASLKKLEEVKSLENKKESNRYNLKDNSSSESILLSVIQENAFWNHHLYSYSFYYFGSRLLLAGFLITILALLSLPLASSDPDYSIWRLILIIPSFIIVYEQIEMALNYRKASIEMLELDNEISRIDKKTDFSLILSLFTKYILTLNMKLMIPESIYKENASALNKAWEERVLSSSTN